MTAQNKFINTNIADNSHLVALQELIDVVAKLRSPEGGCPWDLAQTQTSLTPYIIEEAYEVVDAISTGEQSAICEELGDLLLQVILQAQIASEKGDFSVKEVAEGIAQKLIRRHPHVFGDVKVENVEQVRQNWDEIKAAEKGQTIATQKLSDKLNRYRRGLPPLNAAMKISQKAAEVGFEWSDIKEVWGKFHEELAEFDQALAEETPERQESELGDLLFAIIQLARWYNLERLRTMEQVMDRPISDYKLAELEALWQQAKAKLIDG
jgi:XTP/dITP diphosphohydrolase